KAGSGCAGITPTKCRTSCASHDTRIGQTCERRSRRCTRCFQTSKRRHRITMQKQIRIEHTAAALDAEVKKATKQLYRPSNGDELTVLVAAQDVETRPELFQPRTFGLSLKQVDENNVHKLMRLIGTLGELDPIVVVKLGQRWVCVDGHHRVEAY